MMKGLIGMVTVFVTILLLTGCCSDEEYYKQKFKFKPGEFVTHKVSEDKILITDTIRFHEPGCECNDVTLYYDGVNSVENDNRYDEIELKK
jgi:major membrane immunogen (membrane-anchored lipoprotein)